MLTQVVPAAAVAAGDGVRWRRIFLLWRANGEDEVSVAMPALAAMIGTWFGAWPMPLDWGTAWQVLSAAHENFLSGACRLPSLLLETAQRCRRFVALLQAWPVCCSVGAMGGYCIGTLAAIPMGLSQARAWRESRDVLQPAVQT